MKKSIIELVVKAKYAYYSLKNINRLKLGELVKYDGLDVVTIQGVANPYWDVLFTHKDGKRERINNIHKSELKQGYNWSSLKFRFNSHYNFLMGYWFQIDVNNYKSVFSKISYR